ncbi:hypothetical protein SSBR45G_71180 [Bradyrhizobium sp. SSBR45G]|nr:hypothetical protein SSBR45G_71180 [Bradyrhizobium sp. SSBR45G]GLH89642.1 hypothetical protein SSBR45R_71030 [Bradyrhizobium sp. SSBR45R]
MCSEARAVLRRQTVVLAEDVALDLDDTPARQAGNLLAGRVGRAVDVIGRAMRVVVVMPMIIMVVMMVTMTMIVVVVVIMVVMTVVVPDMIMTVIMSVSMMMVIAVIVMVITGFDRGFAVTAAAHRTHHSTSSSLTRMSSPPVTCS